MEAEFRVAYGASLFDDSTDVAMQDLDILIYSIRHEHVPSFRGGDAGVLKRRCHV